MHKLKLYSTKKKGKTALKKKRENNNYDINKNKEQKTNHGA